MHTILENFTKIISAIWFTVPSQIKGAPIIQKCLFWPSDCHIKMHKKCVIACFLREAATDQENCYKCKYGNSAKLICLG